VQTREIPVIVVSAKSLTAEEWERLYRHTESVWQKGNFSARELVGHVVGVLGDEVAASPSGRTSFTMQSHADHGLDTFGQNGKPLILVVDAVASDARLLHRIFEARQRYHVIEAHSGGKALTLAEQHRPDLIVLNLTLPDIKGTKVLQALREQRSTCNAPAIILSEEKIDAALRTRLASQVDSIWSKNTLDRNHLLAHVEAILSE
jgi:CheY-like chemotaxis protein